VTGNPVAVVQAIASALGVETAQSLFDGRRLGELIASVGEEGFGDAEEADTLLAETDEREEALHWHDRAPEWWRRLTLQEAAAEAKARQAPDMSGAEEYTPEPPPDPHAEKRKRIFDRAQKLATVSSHRIEQLDAPLTGHQLQQNLEELKLDADDARAVRDYLVETEEPTVADYRAAWAQVAAWRESGLLAGVVYEALCASAGLDCPAPPREASGGEEAGAGAQDDPFRALETEAGTYSCPGCGRDWEGQAAAYECCAGDGDGDGDQPSMM
jgi:hypothetical protein